MLSKKEEKKSYVLTKMIKYSSATNIQMDSTYKDIPHWHVKVSRPRRAATRWQKKKKKKKSYLTREIEVWRIIYLPTFSKPDLHID